MMRKFLLLLIIYLAFIGLGLPDSLLGPAWPEMLQDLEVPAYYAGIIAMIVASGTVISSLLSGKLTDKLGVSTITILSVLLTALALIGFSYSDNFLFLCLLAIPLGIGAGSVDAALNNYVAINYRARHMNWLHCFWGVGAAIGPLLMSRYLAEQDSWEKGYNTVGWIQMGLVFILLLSFPLWKKQKKDLTSDKKNRKKDFKELLSLPGLKEILIVFFCYCSLEVSFGLWGASYLVFDRGLNVEKAAGMISLYYIGISLGRFIAGIVSIRLTNKKLIYTGLFITGTGLAILSLPFTNLILPGFFLVGLGCAPIFPALLHETPKNFGEEYSQYIMGIQMASAYIGITLMPLLFGKLASYLSYASFLWFMAALLILQIVALYRTNLLIKRSKEI